MSDFLDPTPPHRAYLTIELKHGSTPPVAMGNVVVDGVSCYVEAVSEVRKRGNKRFVEIQVLVPLGKPGFRTLDFTPFLEWRTLHDAISRPAHRPNLKLGCAKSKKKF